eukprot:10075717-Alexandrium_andersonii.AAC.1
MRLPGEFAERAEALPSSNRFDDSVGVASVAPGASPGAASASFAAPPAVRVSEVPCFGVPEAREPAPPSRIISPTQ